MLDLIRIFIAGYCSVFLMGFQSRNVNHGNYGWAAGTSFLIAVTNVTLWGALFSNMTTEATIAYGLSGCLGITSSMFVHQNWVRKKDPVK